MPQTFLDYNKQVDKLIEIINPSPVEQLKRWYVDLGNLDTKYLDNNYRMNWH
ncbi:MAG: hypothetical protein IJ192_04840 [Clostridia bacterium]|nr:hypothetical protein [Clostridia bacterium]MBR2175661.1 hypothetical protein [Clostridia bacterium]